MRKNMKEEMMVEEKEKECEGRRSIDDNEGEEK